tara:strand:+ start:1503 stop:1883 length:381 start_codon:yes stop_codon:yes gene_type:complete
VLTKTYPLFSELFQMTITQTKSEFLVDSLIEVLNNEWKVNSIESGHSVYTQLEVEVGRKYIKIWSYLVGSEGRINGRSCWMFVNNKTGECLKPASWKAPAKGVRFMIDFLANNCHVCDPYGSFLYL